MKQAIVQTLTQEGNTYGQVSSPQDLMKAQEFVHNRLSQLAHDFVNSDRDAEVVGFPYSLGAGNAFTIAIAKPGRVYSKDGRQFELLADTELTIAEADEELPRIDLVVAVLDQEIPSELDPIPFVRLRTADEFSDGVSPYPPQNISAATELHDRAVVEIRTGTAASVPNPPNLASNEIPLYMIAVAPGAQQIHETDVLDMRDVMRNLRQLNDIFAASRTDLDNLAARVIRNERIQALPIDLPQVFGTLRSLGEILTDLQVQVLASRDSPEIRYELPKVPLTNINASKIIASGGMDGGVPCVNIETGGRVNFGDAEVSIEPHHFVDQSVNPRYATLDDDPAQYTRIENIELGNVTQIASDGQIDFLLKTAMFASGRIQPGCGARSGQYIEVFGGIANDNATPLSEWATYDAVNDTLTPREPSIPLPTSDRPTVIPYGDGTHVLIIAGSSTDDTPGCYKLNAATGDVTAIGGTLPAGVKFAGDPITAGKIFIAAAKSNGAGGWEPEFWEFDTATNLFSLLGVTGSVPSLNPGSFEGCIYADGQFLLLAFDGSTETGRTYIYSRASTQWIEVSVPGPYGGTSGEEKRPSPLSAFSLANINGRVTLVGGILNRDKGEKARIWEFNRMRRFAESSDSWLWVSRSGSLDVVQGVGMCSRLDGNSLPRGEASIFGGRPPRELAKRSIYGSKQAGLITRPYQGFNSISIAPSSTFVTFEFEPFMAPFTVRGYRVFVNGRVFGARSDFFLEMSFDDGVTWKPFDLFVRTYQITDSGTPGLRRLRCTLRQANPAEPLSILQRLVEVFDEDGIFELENRLIVRYDAPAEEQALYIDRKGNVTLSDTIEPSTPEKCLVHKVTPNVDAAPDLKNYINRRRSHVKYTGVAGAGAETVDNELAVPVRYVDARAVDDGDAHIYKIDDPDVSFDSEVTLEGVTTGDTWILELEG